MFLKLARWWLALLGGVFLGGGLVLHGQVAVANHLRESVQGTFFLWRGIGKLTFMLQDEVTQTALTLDEIPASVMQEADRAAWTLIVIGSLLAITSPLVRRRRRRQRRPSKTKVSRTGHHSARPSGA